MDTSNQSSTISENDKWEEKKLEVLLEAASIAIKRARYVFILINISAVIIFTAQFNALFPWLRNVSTRNSTLEHIQKTVHEILQKDLYIMSVPLLGMKVSVFDLTVVGSIACLLLAVWFYYSVRREHLVVEEIDYLARAGKNKDKKAYLYYGIAHYFVYTTANKKETPSGIAPQSTARIAVLLLFFVPFWLPLLIVVSDVISLATPSKIASVEGCFTLWCVLGESNNSWEQTEVILRLGFALLFSLFSLSQCWTAYKWDTATRELVNKLGDEVEAEKLKKGK